MGNFGPISITTSGQAAFDMKTVSKKQTFVWLINATIVLKTVLFEKIASAILGEPLGNVGSLSIATSGQAAVSKSIHLFGRLMHPSFWREI